MADESISPGLEPRIAVNPAGLPPEIAELHEETVENKSLLGPATKERVSVKIMKPFAQAGIDYAPGDEHQKTAGGDMVEPKTPITMPRNKAQLWENRGYVKILKTVSGE